MIVGIKYTEGAGQDSYEYVYVHYRTPEMEDLEVNFDSGDFLKDWSEAMDWVKKNHGGDMILGSSTCDSFFWEEPQRYNIGEGV